ncbi:hypothetical protein Pla123a_41550 [Posidoniimonas polymericola]|uniref:Response regulatory domain-containing protein n=1 Tax=Posidoniimonas polymericola TaxID=2528002 RepID=A0A5C5XYJ8_9BACT|nr:hypothetical protein [Posidoniimonas polymericola]TWT67599.1 hypothetical protein Pla123a_41550 [Posidoniimonas polymericola]
MNFDATTQPELEARSPAARTLCVGALSRAEEAVIARVIPASRLWQRAESLLHAQQILGERPIDRVLLAQSRPGELPPTSPQQLAAWAPGAELMCLAGDWCEGELRSGRPWQDVPRVYWHQLLGGGSPASTGSKPLVLVATLTNDAGQMWVDVLRRLGYGVLATRRGRPEPIHSGEQIAVWDGDMLDGREANALAEFCRRRRRRGARVVAVFDYPRGDVVQSALDLGACAVVGRPWSLEALERALAVAVAPAASASIPAADPSRQAA